MSRKISFTLVFLRGGGYHPQTVCLRLHQNAKQSDPGHPSNLCYILSGHYDEKNPWVPPNRGGRVSRQSPRVRVRRGGWLPPQNILSRHFEKNIFMIWTLNLQNMLETQFPFFISKKPREILIFGTFLAKKKINFGLYFAENQHFLVGHTLLRHCDVIRWPIFMILVSTERKDPSLILWYQTTVLWAYQFQIHGGVVITPLGRSTKKAQEDEG